MCFDKQNTIHRYLEGSCKFDIGTEVAPQGIFSNTEYYIFLNKISNCLLQNSFDSRSFFHRNPIRLELFFFLFWLPPRDFPHYIEYVHFHHTDRSNTQLEVALKCMATYIIHICTVWVLGLHLKGHKVSASNF